MGPYDDAIWDELNDGALDEDADAELRDAEEGWCWPALVLACGLESDETLVEVRPIRGNH